ncbi:hypothetical protein N7466_001569 [Penicillium verhagenii]|uniref:uncharacterized protein n=1 Tax=Penicillium verhagenii TaxID=1562060 RepID=UPI0025456C09|nr:uncharacterized protein N7466_001569 [Penicillium verhagenii]KAJ5938435.1 hypothetical protein N7466_001569 [Penicillium verhagenii]
MDDQIAKTPSDLLKLCSSREAMKDTEGANYQAESKEIADAEAPVTSETIAQGNGMSRFSRPPKHTAPHEDVLFEVRRSKRLQRRKNEDLQLIYLFIRQNLKLS